MAEKWHLKRSERVNLLTGLRQHLGVCTKSISQKFAIFTYSKIYHRTCDMKTYELNHKGIK